MNSPTVSCTVSCKIEWVTGAHLLSISTSASFAMLCTLLGRGYGRMALLSPASQCHQQSEGTHTVAHHVPAHCRSMPTI
eukprot:4090675-Amphidinium_carterae.2